MTEVILHGIVSPGRDLNAVSLAHSWRTTLGLCPTTLAHSLLGSARSSQENLNAPSGGLRRPARLDFPLWPRSFLGSAPGLGWQYHRHLVLSSIKPKNQEPFYNLTCLVWYQKCDSPLDTHAGA